MEKATDEMDLDEWEFLSDDGFLDIHSHGDVGNRLLVPSKLDFDPKGIFDMDYFACHSPNMKQFVAKPAHLDPEFLEDEIVKQVIEAVPVNNLEKIKLAEYPKLKEDQDMISQQVFFDIPKGNEFVDIKMDSPKSGKGNQIPEDMNSKIVQEKNCLNLDTKESRVGDGVLGGLNIWGWRITGIGALCSIGMAAASICIFIIGSQQREKHHQQNQKLQFQMYTDDKRFKQVVHRATKLNQSISSVRSGAFNSAHFTFGGGYAYDGL